MAIFHNPAFDAPVRGPHRNIAIRFGVEKLEWCDYRRRRRRHRVVVENRSVAPV